MSTTAQFLHQPWISALPYSNSTLTTKMFLCIFLRCTSCSHQSSISNELHCPHYVITGVPELLRHFAVRMSAFYHGLFLTCHPVEGGSFAPVTIKAYCHSALRDIKGELNTLGMLTDWTMLLLFAHTVNRGTRASCHRYSVFLLPVFCLFKKM